MRFLSLLLLLLAWLGNGARSENINVYPSLMIQMNQGFLNDVKNLVINYIDANSNNVQYGGQKGQDGILIWELCDITINSFTIDASQTTIAPAAPANLVMKFVNIDASMSAGYTIGEDIVIKVTQSGTVDVQAKMNLDVNIAVSATPDGHAEITIVSCDPDITDFKITFHGGIIDDVMDLFKGVISAVMKPILNAFGCDMFEGPIETIADNVLYNFTQPIPLLDGFYYDTTLTQDPAATSSTFELYLDGRVEVASVNKANIPSPNHQMSEMSSIKDVNIKIELPVVVNSFFYCGILADKLNISITQTMLNALGDPDLLDCQCADQNCIGEVLPGLQQYCPNGGAFGMIISWTDLSQMPSITINSTAMYGVFFNQAVIYAGSTPLLVLNVTTAGNMPAYSLYLKDNRVYGDVVVSHGQLVVVSSMIGNIPQNVLNALWNQIISVVVDGAFDSLFEQGIPLPAFANLPYDISSGVFTMNSDSVQLSIDMTIG